MDSEALMMIVIMPTFLGITAWGFKTLLNFVQQRQLIKQHYILQDKLLDSERPLASRDHGESDAGSVVEFT